MKQSLGHIIRDRRREWNWTLRNLETDTGISNATISQIENGINKNPSFKKICKIAVALDLDLDELAKCVR